MSGTDTGRAVVLIFVHKPALEWFEAIALRQCFAVLGRHPVRLVCPEHMDVSAYRAIVPQIVVDPVPARCLGSLPAYNRFKILPELYRRYSGFEFMLTYELDAFVFRDDLLAWCDAGWDYIGAPWFSGYDAAAPDAAPIGIGNSGFSLRRIPSAIRVGRTLRYQETPREVVAAFLDRRIPVKRVVAALTFKNNFYGRLNDYSGNEDRFWGDVVRRRFPEFRVAPYETARSFSFEVNAARLYRECAHTLPFGCHKWMKYEPDFWRPHIERFGHAWPEAGAAGGARLAETGTTA